MLRYYFTFLLLLSISSTAAPLSPPQLNIEFTGFQANLAWTNTVDATDYTLFYAPYPEMQPINQLNMKSEQQLSVNLQMGDAYYIAIQANNATETSDYSNIEHIR